mmetsp:Transcript_75663/g.133721  ORF Transcript_75663/g.133721 Transcript_75663/m.133721 type:complete len:226 (-) Transcript_75663:163-840(-)
MCDNDVEYLRTHRVPPLINYLMTQIMQSTPNEVVPFLADLLEPKQWFDLKGQCHTIHGPIPHISSNTVPLLVPCTQNILPLEHDALAKAAKAFVEQLQPSKVARVFFELYQAEGEDLNHQAVATFKGNYDVVVTRACTFAAKAKLFPQHCIIISLSNAKQILSHEHLSDLRAIARLGCSFIVADPQGRAAVRHLAIAAISAGLLEEEFNKLVLGCIPMQMELPEL